MKKEKQTRHEYNGVFVDESTYLLEDETGNVIDIFDCRWHHLKYVHPHLSAVECWIKAIKMDPPFSGAMVYPYTETKVFFKDGLPIIPGRPQRVPDEFPPLRILAGSLFNDRSRIRKTNGVLNFKNQ